MGIFSTKSAWGKQMSNVPTNKQREQTKRLNAELRQKRAEKKKREEIKKIKREKLKNKASGGWF